MAHSPSPTPGGGFHGHSSHRRPSASPTSQYPLSKRDKKRNAIENRLKDIVTSFSNNREYHLRAQLNALTRDIHFITRVDSYQNKPLDDGADDLTTEIGSVTGSVDGDTRVPLGRFAAQFVDQVNEAMEERDTALTEVDVSHARAPSQSQSPCLHIHDRRQADRDCPPSATP
jgi:hypothetical protein